MAAVLAELQAMRAEINALRQAPAGGVPGGAPGGVPGGVPVVPPERPSDLRDWCRMALEKFDGTGAPIEAADWLSSVVDKLESFQVPALDWVRYAHQLLKGEVWWRVFSHLILLHVALSLGWTLLASLRGGSTPLLSWTR
jgi:hypothetical protein